MHPLVYGLVIAGLAVFGLLALAMCLGGLIKDRNGDLDRMGIRTNRNAPTV